MAGGKKYTGVVLEDSFLKLATIQVSGKKVRLLNLDKVRLVENLQRKEAAATVQEGDVFDDLDTSLEDDIIFGADDSDEMETTSLEDLDEGIDELDFDEFGDEGGIEETDMMDEAGAASSNELLIYNILSNINPKQVNLGLSIPAGETNIQILKDVDFSKTRKKDLEVIVADRLESLYGVTKGKDYYSYTVRPDGALFLASIDDEPQLLNLFTKARELYSGKLIINDIMPDEDILLGLIRSNYELPDDSITGVLQFGESRSRIMFLKGNQLWIVSPIINEGVKSPKFLNTVFSKILFQLDTGEVPNLDQIIICNNSLGQEAIDFLRDRFQDIQVSEFQFSEDFFESDDISKYSISAFTTAIGAAWGASGFLKDSFPAISFLPDYVKDRQKVFKLQWHGLLLLLLILLTPIVANHFYTQNAAEINRLRTDVRSLNNQITSLDPIVLEYNRMNSELQQIQTKLDLLNELNQNTLQWSTNLHILNSGIQDVNSIWITSMNNNNSGVTEIQGTAVYRNRIPRLADVFHNATLLSVSSFEIREQEVFNFRYVIRNFVEDETVYTPQNIQSNEELTQE